MQNPDDPTRTREPGSRAMTLLYLFVLAVVAAALYTARFRHPGPDAGEFWSDGNVINACRGYDQIGFGETWGLPRLWLAAAPTDIKALYLSYPPGPYWFSYAAWSVGQWMGVDPVLSARLFAQTCGLGSGLLVFLVCTRLARSAPIGALAGMFYILSPAFMSYSAALHHMAYSPLLLLGAMRAWLAFEDGTTGRRWAWLGLTALLFALDCWTNYEHMVFFALFVGVRTAFHFRWPVVLGAALVGPIPVPVMALRVLHNAQVVGGWDNSLNRFRSRAAFRSGRGDVPVDYQHLVLSWLGRLDWPLTHEGARPKWSREFVFPAANPWVLAGLAAIVLSLGVHALLRARRGKQPRPPGEPAPAAAPPAPPREARPARFFFWTLPPFGPITLGLANGLLLLLGGLTWFVVMTQHTAPHRFIVLLLMPGLALLLGTLTWWGIASARAATAGPAGSKAGALALSVRAAAWVLAAFVLGAFAAQVRRADVLNQLAPLDANMRTSIMSRIETNDRVARLGRALREQGVDRVYMYDGFNVMPWRAAYIGLPFLFARLHMPEAIEPTDAIYAEAWGPIETNACLGAIERFGLPDLGSEPSDRMLIFRSPPAPGGVSADLNMAIVAATPTGNAAGDPGGPPPAPGDPAPGAALTLRALRWAPTTLGDHVALLLFITGDFAGEDGQAMMGRFTFSLRIRTPDGREVHQARTRIAWAATRDESRALLALAVPASDITEGCTAQLAIWDVKARAPVFFPEGVPGPLERTESGRRLVWPALASPAP